VHAGAGVWRSACDVFVTSATAYSQASFDELDVDKNGWLSRDELRQAFARMGMDTFAAESKVRAVHLPPLL